MAICYQLDFFKEEKDCEIEALRKEVESIRKSSDKVRRGLFSRHGEITKLVIDIDQRLSLIEKNLCKG